MFLIRLFCSAAVSIFIPSICFYYEILPRSLERKRVSLWPLTSDSLTDNDNIARPNQLRSNKINSAGLEDYYFIEWTFQAVQPLLLLLTVGKFMTGWFGQNLINLYDVGMDGSKLMTFIGKMDGWFEHNLKL